MRQEKRENIGSTCLVFSGRECGHSGTTYSDSESGFIAVLQLATEVFREYQLRRHGDKTPRLDDHGLGRSLGDNILRGGERAQRCGQEQGNGGSELHFGRKGRVVCVRHACVCKLGGGAEKEGT